MHLLDYLWVVTLFFIFFHLAIDLWKNSLLRPLNYIIVINFLLPMLMMYPFSYSSKNIIAVGQQNYSQYLNYIHEVLAISLLGLWIFLISFFVTKKIKHRFYLNVLDIGIKNLTYTYVGAIFTIVSLLIYSYLVVSAGSQIIKGIRTIVGSSAITSILYNIFSSMYTVVAFALIFRIYNKYKKNNRSLFVLLVSLIVIIGLTTGSRTLTITPVLFVILGVYSVKQFQQRKRISLKFIVIGTVIIISMLIFASIRSVNNDHLTSTQLGLFDSFLYGNTFSDFRDTAWIMSGFDGVFLKGKTYLAAILSFIPSDMSYFRTYWSLGQFTNRLAGIISSTHPGLRPIVFGEAFFNFGYFGVVFFSVLFGYVIAIIDIYHKKNALQGNKLLSGYAFFLTMLVHYWMITAGFFTFYIQVIVILIASLFTILKKGRGV